MQLLEKTLIRVGNEEYGRHNKSFALTTMRDQHHIHPAILDAYLQGVTIARREEAAVVTVIARRLKKTA